MKTEGSKLSQILSSCSEKIAGYFPFKNLFNISILVLLEYFLSDQRYLVIFWHYFDQK